MRQCAICGKGSIIRSARKKLRSKYNPTVKTRKYPNLQYGRLPASNALRSNAGRLNGEPAGNGRRSLSGRRALMCTQCLKTLAKKRAAVA